MMANEERAKRYGTVIGPLLARAELSPLGSGEPTSAMEPRLRNLQPGDLFPDRPIRDLSMARAVLSALWLYHNFLDESHAISQSIATPTGSLLHGIMHRREEDYSNAKYWFARVGRHPIDATLENGVRELLKNRKGDHDWLAEFLRPWSHAEFVDFVAKVNGDRDETERICEEIQDLEWWCVFDYAYQGAG